MPFDVSCSPKCAGFDQSLQVSSSSSSCLHTVWGAWHSAFSYKNAVFASQLTSASWRCVSG
mgnify:CR=1 FL=1